MLYPAHCKNSECLACLPTMAASDDDEPDMESKAGGPKKLGRAAKRLVAELSTTFAGKRKSMTLDEFADTVSGFGWQITTTTLRRWRQKLDRDPDWFERMKMTGSRRLLDEEQEILMTGYARHQNSVPQQVTYQSIMAWVQEEFGIEMTLPTMISYCDSNHLSKRVVKIRSASQVAASNMEQQRVALEFIALLETKHFYDVRLSKICCIDITFTGHRKKVTYTIGPTGSHVTLFLFTSLVIVIFRLWRLRRRVFLCATQESCTTTTWHQQPIHRCGRYMRLGRRQKQNTCHGLHLQPSNEEHSRGRCCQQDQKQKRQCQGGRTRIHRRVYEVSSPSRPCGVPRTADKIEIILCRVVRHLLGFPRLLPRQG